MAVRLSHPAFAPLQPWLARLRDPLNASLDELNGLATEADVRVASGAALRFVAPGTERGGYGEYELRAFHSGEVATRAGSRHDLFNALAWLAYPKAKAALNARHAASIPGEGGRRGRLRDLLTLLDEGGAIVACADEGLLRMLRQRDWRGLFWTQREHAARAFEVRVLGHAVLEQALEPWPGITCKALLVPPGTEIDAAAAACITRLPGDAGPGDLPPLPVFGLPGWAPAQDGAFYADERYFRPGPAAGHRGVK